MVSLSGDMSIEIKTSLSGGQKVRLEKILGSGTNFDCITNSKGEITFKLAGKFSYGLFHYELDSLNNQNFN